MSGISNPFFDSKGRLIIEQALHVLSAQGKYLYDAASDTFFYFNGRFYSSVHQIVFEKMITNLFGISVRESCRNSLIKRFKENLARPVPLEDLSEQNKINVKNGVLELKEDGTVSLYSHSHEYYFYTGTDVGFNRTAQCDRWVQFLEQVTQNDISRQRLLQDMFGYCLVPGNWLQVIFILIGGGNNGKSTLLDILRAILGSHSTSSLSLSEIGQRFKSISLRNKLANISDEAPSGKEIASDLLKNVSAGGIITVEEKNKPAFQIQVKAKIITAANRVPILKEQTVALHRRLVVIPFDYEIQAHERDPHLSNNLKSELPGILNWALEGLQRVQAQQALTVSRAANEAKEKFIRDGDNVMIFLEECCSQGAERSISVRQLYRAYVGFCGDRGYISCSDNEFGKRIRLHIRSVERTRLSTDHGREWTYSGVGLNEEAELDYADEFGFSSRH